MRLSQDKKINEYVGSLLKQGWGISRSKAHYKLLTPDGRIGGYISTSPGDRRRGFLNLKTMVKKLVGNS